MMKLMLALSVVLLMPAIGHAAAPAAVGLTCAPGTSEGVGCNVANPAGAVPAIIIIHTPPPVTNDTVVLNAS